MFRSPRTAIALIIAWAAVAAGCGRGDPAGREATADGDRIAVVAAFYPLAELAQEIGGERVDVENLTPAGAEAHDLELTPSQVDAVLDADLVLFAGGGFQPALEEAVERRGDDAAVDLASGPEADPHFWLNPLKLVRAVPTVSTALSDLDPPSAGIFQRAAARYGETLAELHNEFSAGLAECDRRTFVTTHEAFGHLAEAYDLQQESIAGLSPESEPDPDRVAELADRIEELGVTTVFVEPLAPRGAAEALAREARVDIAELDPLESLRPDGGEDYLAVMRANLAALRKALGCR